MKEKLEEFIGLKFEDKELKLGQCVFHDEENRLILESWEKEYIITKLEVKDDKMIIHAGSDTIELTKRKSELGCWFGMAVIKYKWRDEE